MRDSIKAIKFMTVMSFVFLILTYAVSVGIEAELTIFNSIWISKSFLQTIFGGVFASFLVVLLCEIQKYRTTKTNTEDYLFYQGSYLYQMLYQLNMEIEDFLANPQIALPHNMLDEIERMIHAQLSALQGTDYATFKQGNDSLMYEHGKFRNTTAEEIRQKTIGANILHIAILRTEIGNVEACGRKKIVHVCDHLVNAVLQEQKEKVSEALVSAEEYMNKIDHYCGNRFDWVKKKEAFISSCPHMDLSEMIDNGEHDKY